MQPFISILHTQNSWTDIRNIPSKSWSSFKSISRTKWKHPRKPWTRFKSISKTQCNIQWKKNAILVHITKTQVTNEVLDFDSDFLYQRELNADMDFNEEISDHKHISTKTQRTKRKIWISIYTRENLKTQIWISMKKLRFSTSKKT